MKTRTEDNGRLKYTNNYLFYAHMSSFTNA